MSPRIFGKDSRSDNMIIYIKVAVPPVVNRTK